MHCGKLAGKMRRATQLPEGNSLVQGRQSTGAHLSEAAHPREQPVEGGLAGLHRQQPLLGHLPLVFSRVKQCCLSLCEGDFPAFLAVRQSS